MTGRTSRSVRIRVLAIDPPFTAEQSVRFGLQDKRGEVDAVPATGTTAFLTDIEVLGAAEAATDFRGTHVNGRAGDRFLYLAWGAATETDPFVLFARAKIKLAGIPADLLVADAGGPADVIEVECRLQATNDRGQPASGTIRAPAVEWGRRTGN